MKSSSTPELLKAARRAVNTTMEDTELQKKMASYGFPQKRMQEGKALLEHFQLLLDTKEQHYDEHGDLSGQLKADLQAAKATFADHVKVAKVAFRHSPDILRKFKIKKVDRSTWGWTEQARGFYRKVDAYSEQMSRYDVSLEELQQAGTAVEALVVMQDQFLKKKGTAEESTREKNNVYKALRAWVTEFHAAARLAMKDTPQMLEAYGIAVPSES